MNKKVIVVSKKLQISKRSALKGEDGCKTFSIRVREATARRLDEIAEKTNRSRNEIINLILDFGIENCEITEDKG